MSSNGSSNGNGTTYSQPCEFDPGDWGRDVQFCRTHGYFHAVEGPERPPDVQAKVPPAEQAAEQAEAEPQPIEAFGGTRGQGPHIPVSMNNWELARNQAGELIWRQKLPPADVLLNDMTPEAAEQLQKDVEAFWERESTWNNWQPPWRTGWTTESAGWQWHPETGYTRNTLPPNPLLGRLSGFDAQGYRERGKRYEDSAAVPGVPTDMDFPFTAQGAGFGPLPPFPPLTVEQVSDYIQKRYAARSMFYPYLLENSEYTFSYRWQPLITASDLDLSPEELAHLKQRFLDSLGMPPKLLDDLAEGAEPIDTKSTRRDTWTRRLKQRVAERVSRWIDEHIWGASWD